jgi:arylsulfatase A-like enzyme
MPAYRRLADEGVVFRQAYCAGPTCSPSRAALLTGQCAHAAGMLGLAHRGFRLADPARMLSRYLRDAGYLTALAGLQHVAPAAEVPALGYERVWPVGSLAEQNAAGFLAEMAALPAGSRPPFFLDVGFFETHRAGEHFHKDGPRGGDGARLRPPGPLPDAPETRADMAAYWESATRLDAKVGAVLDALDRSGLAGETLVICTTDHGIAFPRMKCSLTGHGTGVLLILRGPGGFTGGRVSDSLVSHVDLFPTVCDLAGLPRPGWLEGVSLLPLVRGEASEVRDAVFAEVTFHAAFEPKRGVRTRQYQYVRNYDERRRPVLPNCDDGPSKSLLTAAGWADRPVPAEELYDLTFDPGEACDRAGDPAYAAPLAEMRERLDRWMRDTGDPLLLPGAGPEDGWSGLPVPDGAVVNPADGYSPSDPPISWSEERERRRAAARKGDRQ